MIYDLKLIPLRNIYYKFIKSNRYPIYLKNKMDKKIRSYHNIHEGETCFVIGNGPSLNISDLEQIQNKGFPTFATNSIYKIFSETSWRPTYYCAQDQQVINQIGKDFDSVIKDCKAMFVRRDVYNQLSANVKSNEKLCLPRLVMHIRKDRYFDFSDNLASYGSDGCTITYLMIQIAYYMGFKKIYLIGIDHNFPFSLDENDNIVLDESIKQDFFEKEEKNRINPARPYEMTMAYKSARIFLDTHGVEIYNATRGGKLEVFKRKNLDDILNDKL